MVIASAQGADWQGGIHIRRYQCIILASIMPLALDTVRSGMLQRLSSNNLNHRAEPVVVLAFMNDPLKLTRNQQVESAQVLP